MNKLSVFKYAVIYLVLGSFLMISCKDKYPTPEFPVLENEYPQPVTKEIVYSKPDTIKWVESSLSLSGLPLKKFYWDKIPSKNFNIGEDYSLKAPVTSEKFYLDSLPSTEFDFNKLPKTDAEVKVTPLGEPSVTKAGSFVTGSGTTRGVMTTNFNFGVTGTAMNLLKEKNGFLWVGTTNGVARYDSENIEMYGAEQGLKVLNVSKLFQDSKGRIWIGSSLETVSVIDPVRKLIYEFSGLLNFPKYGFEEDTKGNIWVAIGNGGGYKIIDFENKTIRTFGVEEGLNQPFGITAFQDNEGLMWLTTFGGINILDLKHGKNIKFTAENGLLSNQVVHIDSDSSGKIWIAGGTGVNIIDKKENSIAKITEDHGLEGETGYVFEDSRGNEWIGTVTGVVYKYSSKKGTLRKFGLNEGNGKFVFPIIEDDENQIWASIIGSGLFRINQEDGMPGNFTTADGLGSNSMWSTLEASDGKIWIGSYDGIDIYDPETKTIKHLGKENGLLNIRNSNLIEDANGRIWTSGNVDGVSIIDPQNETIRYLTTNEGMITNRIRDMVEGPDGRIWMGGIRGELITMDLNNGKLRYSLPKNKEEDFFYTALTVDSKNQIWAGYNSSGIEKIDINSNIRNTFTTENGLISDAVYTLDADAENNIWIGTDRGVQYLDQDAKEITTFKNSNGLAASDVYAIKAHNSKAYVGTSKGINIIEPVLYSTKPDMYWKIKTIGVEQGLNYLDVAQNSISFDSKERMWAGIEEQILTVINEIKDDSVSAQVYITGINLFDKKKDFFHESGVTRPEKKTGDNQNIESEASLGKENAISWSNLSGPYNIPENLELPYDQNFISFNYNALNYRNPESVTYRYFLEGIDKTWSPISEESSSENYRDLPPGDYTFKVRAKGYNNVWSGPAELSFTILPPWWQTWWVYLILTSIFALIIYGIIHYRSQWLKRENRILEEKVSQRTAQLKKSIHDLENTQAQLIQSEKMASLGELTAGIAHEIQNPLNFVNNFSEVNSELIEELRNEKNKEDGHRDKELEDELLKDIAENEKKIRHHGQRADAIVKGMLQHSRNSSAEKELTDINKLADEYLRLSYHGLRAKDKTFNASMKTDFDKSLPKVFVAPQDIGRVILNLINNSFYAVTEKKRTLKDSDYEPTVMVTTEKDGKHININIIDNGRGISSEDQEKIFQPFFTTKPSGQGTGLGLSLSYDIIKTHGGILKMKTHQGMPVTPNGNPDEIIEEGTTFTIQLPLSLNGKMKENWESK